MGIVIFLFHGYYKYSFVFIICCESWFDRQLALKHRQNKNLKQRIILFVGSPVECNSKDLVSVCLFPSLANQDMKNRWLFGFESWNSEMELLFLEHFAGLYFFFQFLQLYNFF